MLERFRKLCQEEKTAAGAAGSEGGVSGKLKFSSSSEIPEGDAGSSDPDALPAALQTAPQLISWKGQSCHPCCQSAILLSVQQYLRRLLYISCYSGSLS